MAWSFGDGFDCYATSADAANGYWDTNTTNWSLVAGRFIGSRAFQMTGVNAIALTKNSGANDAVHHVVVAYQQTAAITGSLNYQFVTLGDGVNSQCTIMFRSDGAILLLSGAFNSGTILATYAGAVTTANTWFAFEFEVVIHNTAGSFKVRKNGNPVDDHSTTGINTRAGSTNNYANRLSIGCSNSISTSFDDLFWRSDASSVAWMGDIRCFTRMPASDASVQFSRTAGATNASCVDEPQQNAATDYVYDSTPGHADFYGIAPIASTPVTTVALTTRAYMQKSDAGTRTAAVQLKSGAAAAVASPTLTLTTSGWQWTWRTDLTDPATGAAWTAVAVNNVTVGPLVVA